MTMGVLLGLGGPAPRAGERTGKESANGIADAFGELVGKSDKKRPGLDKIGLEDEPRGERLGTERGFISMYDLGLRKIGDDDSSLKPELSTGGAVGHAVEDGEQADIDDAAGTDASTEIAPVEASTAKPEYATGHGATAHNPAQEQLDPDAAMTDAAPDKAPPSASGAPVETPSGQTVSTTEAEEGAELQSRLAQPVQTGGAAERTQRTGRTTDKQSLAPQQQVAAAAQPDAPAEPIADETVEAPRAPAPVASATPTPDATTKGEPAHLDQQSKRSAGLSGIAASTRSDDTPADPFAGRVKVVSSNTPASPPPPALVSMLGSTSASVVAAIEADPAWRAAAAELASAATARTPNSGAGVNSLRIQLHPVELGMVTARLTATGTQLSIEIQVESNDARQRLSSDADAIVKALRSVGLEVDKITIQQSPNAPTANGQPGAGARDQQMAGQQMQGEANGRDRGDRQTGNQQRDEARGTMPERAGNRAGGDIYI